MRKATLMLASLAAWLLALPGDAKLLREATPICHLAGPAIALVGQPLVLRVWAVKTTPCDRLDLKVTRELATGTYRVAATRTMDTDKPCIDLFPGATLATISFHPATPGSYTFLADRFDAHADTPEALATKLRGVKPASLVQIQVQEPVR